MKQRARSLSHTYATTALSKLHGGGQCPHFDERATSTCVTITLHLNYDFSVAHFFPHALLAGCIFETARCGRGVFLALSQCPSDARQEQSARGGESSNRSASWGDE